MPPTPATTRTQSSSSAYAISNLANGKLVSETMPVAPNASFPVSAYLHGEMDSMGSEGNWQINACFYKYDGAPSSCSILASGSAPATNWTQVSGTVTSPADAATMKLELVGAQLSGWLAWDDVSVSLDTQMITKYYYAGSQRVAVRKNGVLNYLLNDHLGSASVVTDAGGSLLSKMLYKPWGETRYSSGVMPTDRLYTGQIAEVGLGLYFYNARYYDPYLSRFLSPDNIIPDLANPQSWNRYSYVRDNPLKYTDPTGHWACGDYYDTGCVETFAEAGAMMRSTGMNALAGGKTALPIVARKDWGQYAPGDNPGNFSDEDRETYDPNNEFGGYYEYPGNLADTLDSAVIHHVGDGGITTNPQAIENAHMVGLGHYDVGYHFIAGADGTIYEGRYIGARGYHVQKYNTGKIGVVLIGDFSGDISPTQIQVDATLGLLLYLDAQYGINFINGHSDYPDQGNTICPGQNMAKPINMFRSFIE